MAEALRRERRETTDAGLVFQRQDGLRATQGGSETRRAEGVAERSITTGR